MKKIKHTLLCCALLALQFATNAQTYFTGKFVNAKSSDEVIFYDRTQYPVNGTTFRSSYKIFDVNKVLVYTASVTHDQSKCTFVISLKKEGDKTPVEQTVKYDKKKCGLIFSDVSNTDSFYNITKPYKYLVSFNDGKRDYPILHRIVTTGAEQIIMDPITKIRLKMHNDLLDKIPGFQRPKQSAEFKMETEITEVHVFISQMEVSKKALYKKDSDFNDTIERIRRKMDMDLNNMFGGGKVNYSKRKYEGDKTKGQPDGRGILVDNGAVYSGTFRNGVFQSGRALVKNDNFEYCGEFANGKYNGIGCIKFTNGSYLLGRFIDGILASGVTLSKNQDGETYFGYMQNGQKTGYGELRDVRGDIYYGNFLNSKLDEGYGKETDKFGYVTYSKIDNGTKNFSVAPVAKEFFETIPKYRN